ncbi:NAD(P)-binding protein [Aspergillus leporis]|uniref:NAD(P)-binding protein n=1 Tax=Aspergillus leporis TaxID=41062 RepID=A0A5N5WI79_9EURO|nr:NAD(P)-binding protein [Aspergillus leporis]
MPKYNNVIVFGATGDVGSAVALQAHQEGATVSLAMRNPSKPIHKLDSLPFMKYRADLTHPDTLETAVREAGATAAFIYGIFDGSDYMRLALRALKGVGIEFVVFLSSFIILTEIHAVDPSDIVPWEHAQVENALDEIYGRDSYVTEKYAILQGQVNLPNPDATFDFISPDDIGHVAGKILVNGAKEHIVRLLGPERMTMTTVIRIVGNVLGKNVQVVKISREEATAKLEAAGVPTSMVNWHLHNVIDRAGLYLESPYATITRDNILSYAQHPPQKFLD